MSEISDEMVTAYREDQEESEETLSQRLWRLSQGNVHPERAEAYRRAAVMALDAEEAAYRAGREDAGPQISDEMVTAYRDAWAALPVLRARPPAERVRAGLAAVFKTCEVREEFGVRADSYDLRGYTRKEAEQTIAEETAAGRTGRKLIRWHVLTTPAEVVPDGE